jgi:hypothetical protein
MYTCSDVTRWIATDEYKDGSFPRRVGIALHLLLCKHCSRYLRQLQALGSLVRKGAYDVPASEVESLKKRIVAELCRKG